MKRVIFVGDTFSSKNLDKNVAFLGTKSYYVLKQWIKILEIEEYTLVNSDHFSFPMLVNSWLYNEIDGYYMPEVIALGKKAEKQLKKLGSDYFILPHPSPKNRKLNDKEFIKKELEKCKKWLNNN